ncbi:MAG: phospholipid carrier-dependent glycosyltransferase [Candidatus Sumerlaeia bacterium]|nr:phospholipid carrier-dependent glycosyltransferase [Candidatus Sumerlaeia bacterium]
MSPDEELLFRMTESMATGASTAILPLESDPATGALPQGVPPEMTFATRYNPETGQFFAQYLPLQPLLAVPLYYVARMTEGILAAPFAGVLGPGMHMQYIAGLEDDAHSRAAYRRGIIVMLFNPLVAAISAIMLARLARLITGSRRAGLLAAGAWAFGTIAWPHSRTFFTEPLSALFLLAALEQLYRWGAKPGREGAVHAILIGVFLAAGNLTRVDGPFLTVGIGLGMVWLAVDRLRRQGCPWAEVPRRLPWMDFIYAASIALAAWVFLQSMNTLRFGTADLTSGYSQQVEGVRFTTPILVGLHGLLFSAGKGMFYFSPALLLGIWGWFLCPNHLKPFRTALFLSMIPFFVAMAKWQNWDGGWCWGPRHIVQIHLPLMVGAIFLFLGALSWRRMVGVGAVMIVAAGVQVYGSSQSPLEYYREYFMTYRDLVYHRVNYRPMQVQAIQRDFAIHHRNRDGSLGRELGMESFELPAPMIDSLYLPEHTQWASYREMWAIGYRDWYFWNALTGNKSPDRWSQQ